MGHRAIHPNLCLASRNTYSRSTLGDLEKITEQLEWWAPPYFLFACRLTTRAAKRFLVSYMPLAPHACKLARFTRALSRSDANEDG